MTLVSGVEGTGGLEVVGGSPGLEVGSGSGFGVGLGVGVGVGVGSGVGVGFGQTVITAAAWSQPSSSTPFKRQRLQLMNPILQKLLEHFFPGSTSDPIISGASISRVTLQFPYPVSPSSVLCLSNV